MGSLHTIGQWTSDRALATPDRVAIDDRGVLVSYKELDQRATNLANSFIEQGYSVGDRIATLSGNSADQVVLFFACAKAGLALVPISWRLSSAEVAEQVEMVRPSLLVVEDEFSSLAKEALEKLIDPPMTVGFGLVGLESNLPASNSAEQVIREVRDSDDLLIVFTSGTVDKPKAPILTHSNCFWTNLSLSRIAEITSEDTVLSVMPQYHAGGWNIQPLLGWWMGATVVLERTFDAGRVLHLIEQRKITSMMGVPANYLFLAEHPDFNTTELGSLKHAIVGGAPMPEPLLRTWHQRGVALTQGYGLTEASPNVLCLADEDATKRIGSAGRPYPHVSVKVVDPVTSEELHGEATGELLVGGPGVFKGYFEDEQNTKATLRDGWLHTGDLVHRDKDGFYRIVDRIKDIFITGGESVAPAEIEKVLFGHPAVADCAVVGVPDEKWGEVPVGFVVKRKGIPTDEQDILNFLSANLAKFKIPKSISFIARIPRSSSEKVRRRMLASAWRKSQGVNQ